MGIPLTSLPDPSVGSNAPGAPSAPKELPRLVVDGKPVDDISTELLEWLVHDARERGITVAQAYKEEMEARRELARITPAPEELRKMIRGSGPPAYVANEPSSEFPF